MLQNVIVKYIQKQLESMLDDNVGDCIDLLVHFAPTCWNGLAMLTKYYFVSSKAWVHKEDLIRH